MSPQDFALQFRKSHPDWPIPYLTELLDCYQRAPLKFPQIHRAGLLYTRKALEQSTGEALMNWKSKTYAGHTAFDLSGGLGMDAFAFSRCFEQVHYVDCDATPLELARNNHSILQASNIRHHLSTAEQFLSDSYEKADFIYLDPSRRDERGRVVRLADCSPDVTQLWANLKQRATHVVVKLSPLYDLAQLQRELEGLTRIHVISVQGEVKEILAEWQADASSNLSIVATGLDKSGEVQFEYTASSGGASVRDCAPITAGLTLFEPDAAIIKAGLSHHVAQFLGLSFINHTTDYLIDASTVHPGLKAFHLLHNWEYKPKQLKKQLNDLGLKAVHLHKRDFKESVDELYKRYQLQMGEQAHLFFTKDDEGRAIVMVTKVAEG